MRMKGSLPYCLFLYFPEYCISLVHGSVALDWTFLLAGSRVLYIDLGFGGVLLIKDEALCVCIIVT